MDKEDEITVCKNSDTVFNYLTIPNFAEHNESLILHITECNYCRRLLAYFIHLLNEPVSDCNMDNYNIYEQDAQMLWKKIIIGKEVIE